MRWLPLFLAACVPAPVHFECPNDEPLCSVLEVTGTELPAARGVDITGVYVYQAVEVALMEDGEAVEDPTALVADRPGLVRVAVAPHDDFAPRELVARVYLYEGDDVFAAFQHPLDLDQASDLDHLGTTFDVPLPAGVLRDGQTLAVELVEADADAGSGDAGRSRWPDEGGRALDVVTTGPLEILLVPIEYGADGSDRLPPVDEAQVSQYRASMFAIYPVTEVRIEVGEVHHTDVNVSASGGGWSSLLSEISELRQPRSVPDHVYIYGVFTPNPTFGEYCAGGCVTGLSNLATSASDAWSRASIGVGYAGVDSAETMVHEVGHAHGRSHSPCGGAQGVDPGFPYDNADIGVRGYDLMLDSLKLPGDYADFMSYCSPIWTSDYTYQALTDRVAQVAALGRGDGARLQRATWHTVWLHADTPRWGADRSLAGQPSGRPVPVELLGDGGRVLDTVEGYFSPFSHVDGGVVVFPSTELRVRAVRVADVEISR